MTASDGTRRTVRVAWEPRWRSLARRFGGWRRKRRNRSDDFGDAVDGAVQVGDAATSSPGGGGGGFDLGDAVFVIVVVFFAVIAAAVLFWWVLLPLLVIDFAVVLMLLSAAIVGRVLFRRPWTVEATGRSGERIMVEVVGWRAALRRRDEIAESLRRGQRPVDVVSPGR